jgi:hypothetical protein
MKSHPCSLSGTPLRPSLKLPQTPPSAPLPVHVTTPTAAPDGEAIKASEANSAAEVANAVTPAVTKMDVRSRLKNVIVPFPSPRPFAKLGITAQGVVSL